MTITNKLGLTDETQLLQKEEEISKKKCIELFEKATFNKLKGGSIEALVKLNKYLFGEIYDCAGKLKPELKTQLDTIEKMPQTTTDEIFEKYIALSSLKPFEVGNGRTTRLWLDSILRKEKNLTIDWNKIDKDAFILATEFNSNESEKAKTLLENALSNETDSREVFIKSIDANFAISGLKTYRTRVLG